MEVTDSSFDDLRDEYCRCIINAESPLELAQLLPGTGYPNFIPVIQMCLKKLQDEMEEYDLLLQSEKDEEIEKELIGLKDKVNYMLGLLRNSDSLKKDSLDIGNMEERSSTRVSPVIFARKPSGKVAIIDDLKGIDSGYYETITSLLRDLVMGDFKSKNGEFKRFNNNEVLNGLCELKGYQVRLFFRFLEGEVIYVEMVRIKKDNMTKKDRNEPVIRERNISKDLDMVMMSLEDEDKKRVILKRGFEDFNSVLQMMRVDKRLKEDWGVSYGG